MKSLIRIVVLLVYTFSLKQNAFSQETTSTLSGFVSDLTGQAVSGASVTVQHEATGYHSATQTNSKGLFVIPNLKPGGPYTITISFVGFQTEKNENIVCMSGMSGMSE